MRIEGSTVLVTGANRGLGASFVNALLDQGAGKVYAGMRTPTAAEGRVVPVALDVTDPGAIEDAVERCADVDIVICNAGVTCMQTPLAAEDETLFQQVMDVNFWGPLRLSRAFAPILRSKGDAAGILYILSMASLLPAPGAQIYSSSKAAAAMMALGVREELKPFGVTVSLAYPGFIDTSMSDAFPVPKAPTGLVAERCLNGFLAGDTSIFPDVFAQITRDGLLNEMPQVLSEPVTFLKGLVGKFLERPDAGN